MIDDSFDIDDFYAFQKNKHNENELFKTVLEGIERTTELDQLIIGFWVKIHVPYDQMEAGFMNAIKN